MTLPVFVLACRVVESMAASYLASNPVSLVEYLDYGLHSTPNQLKQVIQEKLDRLAEPHLALLGYGLCGNGLANIHAGKHTLIIPKADDCIAMLLGSRRRYRQEFDLYPGTYYLTKGWLEVGTDPLSQYDALVQKYGEETACWIMDQQYQHYRRLVFIAHSQAELEAYSPRITQVAQYCQRWNMSFEEMIGDGSLVQKLLGASVQENRLDEQFIVIQPGGILTAAAFQEP